MLWWPPRAVWIAYWAGTLAHSLGFAFVAAQAHPAAAEACDSVRFGKPIKGNGQKIRRKRGEGGVRFSIHHQPVVDFVREEDQVILAGQLCNLH